MENSKTEIDKAFRELRKGIRTVQIHCLRTSDQSGSYLEVIKNINERLNNLQLLCRREISGGGDQHDVEEKIDETDILSPINCNDVDSDFSENTSTDQENRSSDVYLNNDGEEPNSVTELSSSEEETSNTKSSSSDEIFSVSSSNSDNEIIRLSRDSDGDSYDRSFSDNDTHSDTGSSTSFLSTETSSKSSLSTSDEISSSESDSA